MSYGGSAYAGAPYAGGLLVTADPPGTPENFTCADASLFSVTLGWGPPTTGDPVTHYEVRVDGGPSANIGLSTTYVAGGLLPDTTHIFEARACNDGGCSTWVTAMCSTSQFPPSPTAGVVACPCGNPVNS